MAKMLTPDEAANAARARQAAKIAAVEAKRAERAAAREKQKETAKLFAAHCADASKAFRAGDADGALMAMRNAHKLLPGANG